jgi:hypothetical protein
MRNEDEKCAVLLECVRGVFPHLRNFSDELLAEKIGSKRLPFLAEEFQSYIQRNQPVGIGMQRTAKLNEGRRLATIVRDQLVAYHYPPVAITPKNLCENLSLIDDYFVRLKLADEEEERRIEKLIRQEQEQEQEPEEQSDQPTDSSRHGITLLESLYV